MIRERLVYKTALSLVTMATSGLVRLVFSLFVGHAFGPQTLGHVNVIVSTAVFATLLCSPGMGQAVARHMATRGLDHTSPEGRSVLVRATAGHHALCLAVAVVAVVLTPAQGTVEHLLAFAMTFGYGCYTYYKAVLYGVDLVRRYAVLELTWDALFVAALVVVALSDVPSVLLAPMVLVYLGFAVGAHGSLFGWRSRRGARPHPPERLWRGLSSFAFATAVGTASSAGFLQLSQIFAARADSGHGSGLFAAAMSLVTPAYLLPRAVSVVLFPAMARAAGRSDRGRVRRQLELGTDVLAAAMLPAFVFVGMMATAVLGLYGSAFHDGAGIFVIMLWATWVSIASVPAVNALSADPGRSYLIPSAASVVGFLVGLAFWLALGASVVLVAWGYLVGSVVQSTIPIVLAGRRHGTVRTWLWIRLVAIAAVALAGALAPTSATTAVRAVVALAAAAVTGLLVLPELRSIVRSRAVPSDA